jgi:hypothetical protein
MLKDYTQDFVNMGDDLHGRYFTPAVSRESQ